MTSKKPRKSTISITFGPLSIILGIVAAYFGVFLYYVAFMGGVCVGLLAMFLAVWEMF